MSRVSKLEGRSSCQGSVILAFSPFPSLRSHTRRHSWSPAGSRGTSLRVDNDRQIHPVGRGVPDGYHHCRGVLQRTHQSMDFAVRRARFPGVGPRNSVHQFYVERTEPSPWHQERDHDGLPSTSQRHGGKIPQAVKGFVDGGRRRQRLDGFLATRPPRTAFLVETRFRRFPSRTSLWRTTAAAWRFRSKVRFYVVIGFRI